MRRTWKTAALTLAGVLVLSGCGSNGGTNSGTSGGDSPQETSGSQETTAAKQGNAGSEKEPVTLSLWADFVTPERTRYVETMVADYMAAHPEVKIEVTPLPDSADDKIMTAYEAGQGPDIFLSSGPDITSHINGEYVIPLDEYFENWDQKELILPAAVETVRQYDVTGNNRLYYIPNGISFTVLWVRSDWLKDTNSSVDTWDHLFEAVENMTDKANNRYGIAIRGGKGGAKFLERQMYAYSGILSKFDENGKCTINDPKNVEFVERYLGLYGT